VIPFSYGLHRAINNGKGSKIAPILLAGAGVLGVILTLFFPCDPGCEPVTFRGIMHILIAIPMGFLILFAILAFSRRLKNDKEWNIYSRYSLITFIVGILLGISTVVLAKASIGGLLERILTASYLQWYVIMGMALIRRKPRLSLVKLYRPNRS